MGYNEIVARVESPTALSADVSLTPSFVSADVSPRPIIIDGGEMYGDATTTTHGLMSAADKQKLDSLVPLTSAEIDAITEVNNG